jgi:tetratricopeptide (TPR) repeat protein
LHNAQGRSTEALAEINIALEIYSASPIIHVVKSVIHYEARQYDASIEQFLKTLEIDPNFDAAHYGLALAYTQKKMFKEAIESAQTAIHLAHNGALNLTVLCYIYAVAGRIDEAKKVLDELKRMHQSMPYISPFHMAAIDLALGKKNTALKWLKKAATVRDPWIVWLKIDPRFDDLHGHPEFDGMLRDIGV